MKFSKKGQQKLVDFLYDYGAYVTGLRANSAGQLVFEPDDFKDVVVLPVKGAKDIASKLGYLAALTTSQEIENDALELQYLLLNRIGQSEMSKQSTRRENVMKNEEKIITLTAEAQKLTNALKEVK